jgi:hypothetical protein
VQLRFSLPQSNFFKYVNSLISHSGYVCSNVRPGNTIRVIVQHWQYWKIMRQNTTYQLRVLHSDFLNALYFLDVITLTPTISMYTIYL